MEHLWGESQFLFVCSLEVTISLPLSETFTGVNQTSTNSHHREGTTHPFPSFHFSLSFFFLFSQQQVLSEVLPQPCACWWRRKEILQTTGDYHLPPRGGAWSHGRETCWQSFGVILSLLFFVSFFPPFLLWIAHECGFVFLWEGFVFVGVWWVSVCACGVCWRGDWNSCVCFPVFFSSFVFSLR